MTEENIKEITLEWTKRRLAGCKIIPLTKLLAALRLISRFVTDGVDAAYWPENSSGELILEYYSEENITGRFFLEPSGHTELMISFPDKPVQFLDLTEKVKEFYLD